MRFRPNIFSKTAVFFLAAFLLLGFSAGVAQAKKTRSIKTEATFIAYDAEAKTLEVKVKKKGKKPVLAKWNRLTETMRTLWNTPQ